MTSTNPTLSNFLSNLDNVTPEEAADIRAALGAGAGFGQTVATPVSNYAVPIPDGTPSPGSSHRYFVTSDNGGNLTLVAGIRVPSDSGMSFPKALAADKLYIVQLTYSGSFWMLTSLVGGY